MSRRKQVRWLHGQAGEWVAKGIITQEQGAAILAQYAGGKGGPPWGAIIFSGIGAVVIGLGVILLFAYNWAYMPKGMKLALVFGAVAAAHIASIRQLGRDDWRRHLGEALSVLATMLFGAGIWLIAQIYHIDEHFPNAFLVWGLGALAMAWAMGSAAQGVVAAALLTVWGCTEAWGFDTPVHVAPLLIAAGVAGLALRLRSRVLLACALAALYTCTAGTVGVIDGRLVIPVLIYMAGLFIALGLLAAQTRWFPSSGPVWGFFGWSVLVGCMFLLTFTDATRYLLLARHRAGPAAMAYAWAPFLAAMGAWVMAGLGWLRQRSRAAPVGPAGEAWLAPCIVIVCMAVSNGAHAGASMISLAFNLVFLALSVSWMARGCREGAPAPAAVGSVMLAMLVFARYFDLFVSLAARGFMFLVVGGVLFSEGIMYMRARRRMKKQEVQQ